MIDSEKIVWNQFSIPVSTLATPHIPTVTIQMDNPPNQMQRIVASSYAPLILYAPLHDFPQGDYLIYLPKFHGRRTNC